VEYFTLRFRGITQNNCAALQGDLDTFSRCAEARLAPGSLRYLSSFER